MDGWMDGWMDASEETDRARWMYVLETNAGRAVAQMAKDSEDYRLYLPKEAQHYGLSKPLRKRLIRPRVSRFNTKRGKRRV